MKKILISIFIFINIFVLGVTTFAVENTSNENLGLIEGAKAGILIEQTTGEVLYQKNSDEALSPASMTKIMTLLLTFEAIDSGILTYDKILTASSYAESMGGSNVYLATGEKMSVDEALKCICIASANDCAVMIAEEICGSEALFVSKMNERAKDLGCTNTNFTDCTGLNKDNHYTSANDLAKIARELVSHHPKVLEYTSIKEDYIRKDTEKPFWLVNTNKLAGRVDGIDGLKTGYTSFSGYCITLHMTQNNMSLISVVFGYESSTKRNSESLELLRYGFSNYELYTIVKKQEELYSFDTVLYENNKISFCVDDDISILIKKGESSLYSIEYEKNNVDSLGKIRIIYNNDTIKEADIVTLEANKKSYFDLLKEIILNIFK